MYVINAILVLMVIRQLREHSLDLRALAVPVLAVAAAAVMFLHSVPAGGSYCERTLRERHQVRLSRLRTATLSRQQGRLKDSQLTDCSHLRTPRRRSKVGPTHVFKGQQVRQ